MKEPGPHGRMWNRFYEARRQPHGGPHRHPSPWKPPPLLAQKQDSYKLIDMRIGTAHEGQTAPFAGPPFAMTQLGRPNPTY